MHFFQIYVLSVGNYAFVVKKLIWVERSDTLNWLNTAYGFWHLFDPWIFAKALVKLFCNNRMKSSSRVLRMIPHCIFNIGKLGKSFLKLRIEALSIFFLNLVPAGVQVH